MAKDLLLLLLLGHIVGDFYLQTNQTAKAKNDNFAALLRHSALYLVALLLAFVSVITLELALVAGALAVSHAVIDWRKSRYVQSAKDPTITANEPKLFFYDQLAHLVCLLIAAMVAVGCSDMTLSLHGWSRALLSFIDSAPRDIFNWVLLLLLVGRPAQLTIARLLTKFDPKTVDDNDGVVNAGAWIGVLERVTIALLLAVNQYAAIGLVLTAKSVARHDKIAKDQRFAEYYLLGTLLSTLWVIVAYLLIF